MCIDLRRVIPNNAVGSFQRIVWHRGQRKCRTRIHALRVKLTLSCRSTSYAHLLNGHRPAKHLNSASGHDKISDQRYCGRSSPP